MDTVEIVAALVWDEGEHAGKFLICQRTDDKPRGGLYEFVGGKVRPGESHAQALIRECRELMAITVDVEDLYFDIVHEYPEFIVHLYVYHARVLSGVPQMLDHKDIRFITPREVNDYPFCPADDAILEKIRVDYDL